MHRRDTRPQGDNDHHNGESRRGGAPPREEHDRPGREQDEERAGEQQFGERRYGRGPHGYDPERDRYAEPRGREFGRGDRDFQRERWEMGGWESGPRRYPDERGEGSYRQYGQGAYAQAGYNQGGYDQDQHDRGRDGSTGYGVVSGDRWSSAQRDFGPRDIGRRDFGESGYGQHDFGPGNYGRGGVGEGGFGHYGESRRDLGMNQRGHHGRGPRGYKRSDERIHEDVCDCLMQDAHVDASEIEVKVSDGTVTLEGAVESRRIKHMAENLCESIPGVQDVTNHLRIQRPDGGERAGTGSTSRR